MGNKIIVCGGNGAGKSTVGKRLAQKLGWTFRDIEDYYFPVKTTDNKYAAGRTGEEVAVLLAEDMKCHDNLVLASVRGNHSDEIASMFTCAIVVEVPKETRMKRVRDRAYKQFGDRILPGGGFARATGTFLCHGGESAGGLCDKVAGRGKYSGNLCGWDSIRGEQCYENIG